MKPLQTEPEIPPSTSTWSWLSLTGPVLAGALLAFASRLEEDRAIVLLLVSWMGLGLFVLIATLAAFSRKERARWVAALSLLVMLFVNFGGASG